MNISKILILAVLLIIPLSLRSQVHEEWDVRYRGANDDAAAGKIVKYDSYGNVYVLASNGFNSGSETITIKYNNQGILQWASRVSNSNPIGMVVDNLGNIFIGVNYGGYSNSVIKYSSFGAIQWQTSKNYATINDMVMDDFGNIYITGKAYGTSYSAIETAKLDPSGTVLWTQTYSSSNNYNSGAKIVLDNAGNVYSMGNWNNSGSYYSALLKYDNNGTPKWVKLFSQGLYEYANLGVDDAGNVYCAGTRWGQYPNRDFALFKFNSLGTEVWSRFYNSEFNLEDSMLEMEINNKGDVFVTGYSILDSHYTRRLTTMKYDSTGTIKWRKDISGSSTGSMTKDMFGNIYLAIGREFGLIRTVKYDTSGTQKWQIDYIGVTPYSSIIDIAADNYGNVYLCGGTSNVQHPEALTIRYLQSWNSNFTVTGCVSFKDNGLPVDGGYVKAVKLDKYTGNVVTVDSTPIQVSGYYSLKHIVQDSLYLIAYPPENQTFAPAYYPQGINWKNAVKMYATSNMSDMNISVQRMETVAGSCTLKGRVVKTDKSLSNLKDAFIYVKREGSFAKYSITDGNGIYQINSVLQGAVKIYVDRLGYSSDSISLNLVSGNTYENLNFNLSQIYVGIIKQNDKVPTAYSLGQNYPNPFNPMTNFKFSMLNAGDVKIVVYDVMGREVQTLVNKRLNAGTYEVRFDARHGGSSRELTSGVYFYRMVTEGYLETKRMLLIK